MRQKALSRKVEFYCVERMWP